MQIWGKGLCCKLGPAVYPAGSNITRKPSGTGTQNVREPMNLKRSQWRALLPFSVTSFSREAMQCECHKIHTTSHAVPLHHGATVLIQLSQNWSVKWIKGNRVNYVSGHIAVYVARLASFWGGIGTQPHSSKDVLDAWPVKGNGVIFHLREMSSGSIVIVTCEEPWAACSGLHQGLNPWPSVSQPCTIASRLQTVPHFFFN